MKMNDTNKQFPKLVAIAIFSILIIALLLKNCKCGSGGTTVKVDTVYKEIKGDVVYIPKIDSIYFTRTATKLVPYATTDTLYIPELKDVDTVAILSDYYKAVIYKDTLRNQYGTITVTDTLSQNRIKGRGVRTNLSIPEITKTITLTQPKRAQVYLGAGLLGNEIDFLRGYEVNISLKTKQDRIVGIGYQQLFNNEHLFKLEYRMKISFRKQ